MIYFDNASTTQISEEVLQEIINCSKNNFANASSLHKLGYLSEQMITSCKKDIANILNIDYDDIYFTSGATESNNMAILGAVNYYKKLGNKIITTKIEHPSILNPFKELENKGFNSVYADVDKYGYIKINNLLEQIDENTIFVSISHINNEIGTIQNIEEIAKLVKQKNKNAIFHTDYVQGLGKIKLNLENVDLMSFSGHKIGALKGIGGIYIKKGIKLNKIIFGADQQNNIRSGTINNEGVASIAKALKIVNDNIDKNYQKVKEIKNEILKLKDLIEGVSINGDEKNASPYILSLSFENVKAEVLVHSLEQNNIYVSTGSACSSKYKKSSSTINIISKENSDSTIRLSFSHNNTLDEAKEFNNQIIKILPMLRIYRKK